MEPNTFDLTAAQALGLEERQLAVMAGGEHRLLPPVLAALTRLQLAAAKAGFELQVASSFRSFERQLAIWNGKALGQRQVLDSAGQPLDISAMSDVELMWAILRWSALPGASRHHWGTDLDVYDASRMAPGYQLQLTRAECEGDGPCSEFHAWLSTELANGNSGFYRPYDQDRGGVAPEPWHLSYAPLAQQCERLLTLELLEQQILVTDIQLKPAILASLPEIYRRFVCLADLG